VIVGCGSDVGVFAHGTNYRTSCSWWRTASFTGGR